MLFTKAQLCSWQKVKRTKKKFTKYIAFFENTFLLLKKKKNVSLFLFSLNYDPLLLHRTFNTSKLSEMKAQQKNK
jgi:hypothetical protein